jgi:hypothetical protein
MTNNWDGIGREMGKFWGTNGQIKYEHNGENGAFILLGLYGWNGMS